MGKECPHIEKCSQMVAQGDFELGCLGEGYDDNVSDVEGANECLSMDYLDVTGEANCELKRPKAWARLLCKIKVVFT